MITSQSHCRTFFCNENDRGSRSNSNNSDATECDDDADPLSTAMVINEERSHSAGNKNTRKCSSAAMESIEEEEEGEEEEEEEDADEEPALFTEPFDEEEDLKPMADVSYEDLAKMVKDEKARAIAYARAKRLVQRYISAQGDIDEFPLGIFMVHSLGSGEGISISEDGTQLFPLGLRISRLESYHGLSSGKERVVRCTLEVLPLADAKQRNLIDCPCRVSKDGGSCVFSISIEGLQRGEGPKIVVNENLELAWARVLWVLGKYKMARDLEDDVCGRLEARHAKAGKRRQPIDEEEMSLRSQIADLAETLHSVRQQAIAYRKLLTVLTYKQQEPIPIISDTWKTPRQQSTCTDSEKEELPNICTSPSVDDDKQLIFSRGLCVGGFLSPSLMRTLESHDDTLADPHYIFMDHRWEERNSGRCACSLDDLCWSEREADQELSWKESSWKARRVSLDKRKDGNTQRRRRKKRELEEMADVDFWGGEVKPEKESNGPGGRRGSGGGVNRRLEKLHTRRRQKEMRDQAKEEEKYVRSVKRGLESELTRRRFAARSLVQAVAEIEELRSLTGQTEEVMKEDEEIQKEDESLRELCRCVPAPSGKCISQNEAPGLQHLTFGSRDVSDLVFVWDFLHVFQNRLSLCHPSPSLANLSTSLATAETLRLNLHHYTTPFTTGVVGSSSGGGDVAMNGKVMVPKPPPTSREAQHRLELLHNVAGSITALLSGPMIENLGITTFILGEGGGGSKGGGINGGAGPAEGESASLNSEAIAPTAEDMLREQIDVCSWPGLAIMNLLSYAYKEMGVDTYQKNKGNVHMGSPVFIESDRRNGRLLRERLLLRWRTRARMQRDDYASLEELDDVDGLESSAAALPPSNKLPSSFRCRNPSDVKVTIPIPSVPSCGPETWEFHVMCIMDMDPKQVSVCEVMTVLRKGVRASMAEARGGGSNGTVASKAIKPLLRAINLCKPLISQDAKNEDEIMEVILACKAKAAETLKLKLSTTTNTVGVVASSDLTKFQSHPVFRSVLPGKFNAADVSGYMNVTEAQHRAAVEAKEHYKTLALASVAALTRAVFEEEDEGEGDIEVEAEDGDWVPEIQVKSEGGTGTAAQVGKSQNVWEIDQSLLLEHARNEMLSELNAAIAVEGTSDSTKRCCRLVLSLVLHPIGSHLIERVDPSSNTGYYEMVTCPLALRDIVDYLLDAVSRETSSTNVNGEGGGRGAGEPGPLKLNHGVVHSNSNDLTTLIVVDVRHIFANALWFGGAGSRLWECATKLSFIFERLVFDWIVDPKAPSHDVLDDRLCQTCFSISSAASTASPSPPPLSSPSPISSIGNSPPPPLSAAAPSPAQGDLVVDTNDAAQQLLVCVRCEAKHHIKCAGVKRVPHGDWFCSSCVCEKSLRDIDPLVGTIAYLKTPSNEEKERQKFIIKDVSWCVDEFAYSLQPVFPSSSRGSLSVCADNPGQSSYVLGSDLRSAFELDGEASASPSPRYIGVDTPGYAGWGGGTVLPHSGRLPLGLNPLICCQASELDSTNPEFAAVGQAIAVLFSGESSSAQMGGKAWLAVLSALSQASVGGLSESLSRSLVERETSALANAKGSLKEYQSADTPQDVLSLPVNLRMPLREDLNDHMEDSVTSSTAASQDDEEEDDIDEEDYEEGGVEEEEDYVGEEEEEEEDGGEEKSKPLIRKRRSNRKYFYNNKKSRSTNDESVDKMNGGNDDNEEAESSSSSTSGEETMGSDGVVEPEDEQQKDGEDEFGREGSYSTLTPPRADGDRSSGGGSDSINIPSQESLGEEQQQLQQRNGENLELESMASGAGDNFDDEGVVTNGSGGENTKATITSNVKSSSQQGVGSKSSTTKVSPSKRKASGGTTKPTNPKTQLGRRPPFEDDLLLHAVVDEVSKAIDKGAAKEAMQRVDPTFLGPGEGGGPLTEAAALITLSPTPVMCAYCDLPEVFLCSPFVWSQSWHEALMLRLGTNKVEMALEMEEDSDYRKNVLQLVKQQLGALGLTPADNANLYRDPFRCVWYPQNSDLAEAVQKQPYDFVPGGLNSLGDDVSVIFMPKGSVIAHDCCARAMVTHRNTSQSRVILKMRKEAVESAAHMLAGDRTQPVGADCTGRLYWIFTHRPSHVFVEPGSADGGVVSCSDWIVLDSLEDIALLCLRLDARNVPELELARGILRYNPPLVNALCDDKFMKKLCAERVPNKATTAIAGAATIIAAEPPLPISCEEETRTHRISTSDVNNVEKNRVVSMEVEEEFDEPVDVDAEKMPKKTKCCFDVNSSVLVRPRSPGGLWYAAHVINCHDDGAFTVSFVGWPQRFNTRVEGSRLAPDDDENAVDEAKTSHTKWISYVEASGLSVPSGIPGLVATAHLNAGSSVNKSYPAPAFRQEDIMSNMLLVAKAALLTIEAALPDGALLRGRGWHCEGDGGGVPGGSSVDVDGEEGGKNSWFSENWTRAVSEAQTAEELMEACIILESSISTRWLHGHFEEGLQRLLPPRSIALRFPSFSDVALRVWVIDKAILYDFTTAPPRAAIGRSGRNRIKGKPKGGGGSKKK